MATYDRKFEIIQPSWDNLIRLPLKVANDELVNPNSTAVVPLIAGEFVQVDAQHRWARGSDNTKPAHAVLEWRGDYGVQASRKLAVAMGTYVADTIVYNTSISTVGGALSTGAVNNANTGSVARWGLITHPGGSAVTVGYVMRLPSGGDNLLRFVTTAV